MDIKEMVNTNTILKIKCGSNLYGTNTINSDIDYFGVCIPTKDYTLGIYKFELFEERTNPSNSTIKNYKYDTDYTCYSIQKYFKLLMDGNPNIIETLFVNEDNIEYCDPLAKEILDNKHLFITKRLYYKFSGYAKAQKRKLITKQSEGLRKELVDIYGWDVKYGMNLIRLLLFGVEVLDTGIIKFPTNWAKYLIQIKQGQWALSHVLDKANYLEQQLENAFNHTKLSNVPDIEKISNLQIKLIEEHWRK